MWNTKTRRHEARHRQRRMGRIDGIGRSVVLAAGASARNQDGPEGAARSGPRGSGNEGDERIRTADGGFADPWLNHLPTSPKSGRRDSNPRRPAWEAGILPLNYSRNCPTHPYSTETTPACQASGRPSSATAFREVMSATSASVIPVRAARWRATNGRKHGSFRLIFPRCGIGVR
jgi:hypothetical protein